jgi:hypothetical protein
MGIDHFVSCLSEAGQPSCQQVSTEVFPGPFELYGQTVPLLVGEVSLDGWWDVVLRALIH